MCPHSHDQAVAKFFKCEDDVFVIDVGPSLAVHRTDVGMMNEFETTLRSQVNEALQTLAVAQQTGHNYEAHLHGARIRDLLDLAARHGVNTGDWVDPAVLDSATLGD
jgi:hypothetical protein